MIVSLDAADAPARLPSPFASEPAAIARRAAAHLMASLDADPVEGKMYGVLVVRAGTELGYLRAFSGLLGGRRRVAGFVGPVFDEAAHDAFWPDGEAELATIDRAREAAEAVAIPLRATATALADAQGAELAAMTARHAANRAARHAARATADADGLAALDRASRVDSVERRDLERAHAAAIAAPEAAAIAAEREVAAIAATKTARSRDFLRRIHATYHFANARGDVRTLVDIFAPHAPPGGAGDCAAPKLFAHAYRAGFAPVALAEFWWGPPPPTGDRRHATFYPACRGKCGPILAHVLDGLDAEPAPIFGIPDVPDDAPRVIVEDAWLAIVDKPVGLLSVPGRSGLLRDSVATRLRARDADALVVHRLDLDTSGALLVAKDRPTFVALQKLFATRAIAKRYVAILDGELAPALGERGTIALPMRVDVDDRPRQIHDPVHGKAAVTEWEVVAREGGRTRVAFVPHTGRTHQLRVHASHPQGLGVPIVGDRIYGRGAGRLMLHAESLAFVHPHTGARIAVTIPVPF